jgi:hypothetical protein
VKLVSSRWAALVAVGLLAGPADAAGTFYGAGPQGFLIRIDVATGAGTLVATLPPVCAAGTSNAVTEIEVSNLTRRAFAQCGGGDFSGFAFDPLTGAALSGEIPNAAGVTFTGLETIGSTWYGTSITAPTGPYTLQRLDPFTGDTEPVGPTGVGPLSGLAYDKRSGVLYAVNAGGALSSLYTIDLTTGAATLVGATGIIAGSLEFGPDGRLYAGGGNANAGNLYVIDPRTAASTLVGPTGFGTLSGLMLFENDCNDPANPFQNCGFESGDFTSWTTQDHPFPFFPLTVDGAGVIPGFGLFTSDPTEGGSAALHGFDGGTGPNHIRIAQDVSVPGGGLLEFDYRAGWDIVTFCTPPCADRSFDVVIEPAGGGTPLATTHILTAPGGTVVLDTLDALGSVDLGAFAGQDVRVVFDWLVPEASTGPAFFQLDNVRVDTPDGFFTVTPCRVIDTRNPDGRLFGPALAAGADRTFPVVGSCGIPKSARAVSVNIAIAGATATGNLRLRAGGTAVPGVASINYAAGQTRSNNAIVPLSATGAIAAFVAQASGTVHLILDVNGYFQ